MASSSERIVYGRGITIADNKVQFRHHRFYIELETRRLRGESVDDTMKRLREEVHIRLLDEITLHQSSDLRRQTEDLRRKYNL